MIRLRAELFPINYYLIVYLASILPNERFGRAQEFQSARDRLTCNITWISYLEFFLIGIQNSNQVAQYPVLAFHWKSFSISLSNVNFILNGTLLFALSLYMTCLINYMSWKLDDIIYLIRWKLEICLCCVILVSLWHPILKQHVVMCRYSDSSFGVTFMSFCGMIVY